MKNKRNTKRLVIKNRRKFISFLALTMVFVNLLLFGFVIPNITKADVERTTVSVVVCSGDTLWSIAKEYTDTPNNIRNLVYTIKKTNRVRSSSACLWLTILQHVCVSIGTKCHPHPNVRIYKITLKVYFIILFPIIFEFILLLPR